MFLEVVFTKWENVREHLAPIQTIIIKMLKAFNALSANPTKWSNTLLFECVWQLCEIGA